MISFRATAEVPQLPDEDTGMPFTEMFKTITKGTVIYDILAMSKPSEMGGTKEKIGELVLNEKFTDSKWGDSRFFIRHQYMNDDLKIHPEWTRWTYRFGLTGGWAGNTCSIEDAPLDKKCPRGTAEKNAGRSDPTLTVM